MEADATLTLRVEGLPRTTVTLSSLHWLLGREFPDDLLVLRRELEAAVRRLEQGDYGELTIPASECAPLRRLLYQCLLDIENPTPDALRELELQLRLPAEG